jgi:hypothetical protein
MDVIERKQRSSEEWIIPPETYCILVLVILSALGCWHKDNWGFTKLYNLMDEIYWRRWCVHRIIMDSLMAFYWTNS